VHERSRISGSVFNRKNYVRPHCHFFQNVRSVYNEERGGFGPLRAPQTYPKHLPSVETNENNEILFIDKIKHATRSGVRSNAGFVFERNPACVRRSGAHSTAKAS
jgi:hypothetical protein